MTIHMDRMREVWANMPLGIRVMFALVATGLATLPLGRPLGSVMRSIALERNCRLAEDAIATGDAHEARSRGLAAIQSAPDRLDAARTVLRSMDLLNDPKSIQVATILMQHPAARSSDRRSALEVLARRAPMVMVGAVWAGLSDQDKALPEMIDAFARRLIAEGRLEQAASLLGEVDISAPPDLLWQLLVDLLRLEGSPEAWKESQKLLFERAMKATDSGEPIPDWCFAGWESVPQRYLDSQAVRAFSADGPPRVKMLRRRMEQGERVLDLEESQVAGWLREVQPGDRLALASLLSTCGHPSVALGLFEKAADLTMQEYEWIREQRIQNLGWQPWLDFLGSPAVLGISEVWVNADRALAHLQLHEHAKSDKAWREAIRSAMAPSQSPRLVELSRRVREWMPKHSEEAMLAAIASPGEPLPLFNDLQWLMKSLEMSRNERALLDVSRTYLRIEPGNPVLVTRYAYLALLSDELSPAAALRMISPVIGSQPDSPHPRMVAVIANLLLGDASQAQSWLSNGTMDWCRTQPFYRWLASKSGNQKLPGESLDPERLLPSEVELVRKLR